MTTAALGRSNIFQVSMIAFPLAFAGLPLYLSIPDYYITELDLGLGLAGVLLLALRLFDAIQDPIFGYIADRWPQKRPLFLLAGMAGMLLGLGALFFGPQLSTPVALWFTLSILVAAAGLSILSINASMIAAFWQNEEQSRLRISGWREALGLTGMLVASILPFALLALMPRAQTFEILFGVFALVLIPAVFFLFRFLRRLPASHVLNAQSQHPAKFLALSSLRANKSLYSLFFLTHFAAALPAVLFVFFVRDYLASGTMTGAFLMLYFIAGAVFMPLWLKLSGRIGTKKSWLLSMGLASVTFLGAAFLSPGDVWLFALICVLSGIALGADLAIPPVLLAQSLSANNKEHEAASAYALMNLMPKLALALASGLAFVLLQNSGFTPGQPNAPEVLQTLPLLYAALPCLIKIGIAAMLWIIINKEEKSHEHFQRSAAHGRHIIS